MNCDEVEIMDTTIPALYIDPSIGIIGLQALAGMFVGGTFYFRRALGKFLGRLGLRRGPQDKIEHPLASHGTDE